MKYSILPKPKQTEEKEGKLFLRGRKIVVTKDIDERVKKAAEKAEGKLLSLGITDEKSFVTVDVKAELGDEAYELFVTSDGIKIYGGDAAGCYYGIKTFLQIVENEGAELPCLYIKDFPDMKYRGFYHDATRGRVPSVEGVKKLVDRLSDLKVNSLQLYVEHTFDFVEYRKEGRGEDQYLTPKDLFEIDEYCYENFIDFVPSLSTFGHLYELLTDERYRHLCELIDYKDQRHFWVERMGHHTIDPSNPESEKLIFSLIDQYLPNFRSKYFNICCDETFDLGHGRNAGKDKGKIYCEFVSKITKHITEAGKTVMMWGDIALAYPNALSMIPKETIILNWDYGPDPYLGKIKTVADAGLAQIVCPGSSTWSRLIENPSTSSLNIMKMAKSGYENGAFGILNTNWGDYGHPCASACALYGLATGAAYGWNIETEQDEEFANSVSKTVYGSDENVVSDIFALGKAHSTVNFGEFLEYLRTDDPDVIRASETTLVKSMYICDGVISKLQNITDQKDVFRYIITAAEGIKSFNRISMMIKTGVLMSEESVAEIEKWLSDYRVLWLTESKESELSVIEKFVRDLVSF